MNNTFVSLAVHTISLPFPTDGPPAATVWHRRMTAESDRAEKNEKLKRMAQEDSNELRGAALREKTNSSQPKIAGAHAEEGNPQKMSQLCCSLQARCKPVIRW